MIKFQCLSNNATLSHKLCQFLTKEDISVSQLPLNYKTDRYKQITIIIINTKTELDEWIEYTQKIGASKKNLSLKFVLPLIFVDTSDHEKRDFNGIPLSAELSVHEVELVKTLLKQKVDYFQFRLSKYITKSEKYLYSMLGKLNWKNQVVLTGEEVSSFINIQSFESEKSVLGDSLPLMKFWDTINDEADEEFILLNVDYEIYKVSKSDMTEDIIRKLILFSMFQNNFEQQKHKLLVADFMINFYESVFQLAPFPIAIELSERDLIWQNKTFSNLKLLPRNVKKMSDNENIHTAHGFFVVYKHQFKIFDLEYKLVYLAQQSEKFTNASEDLGIMTSSLAHEMNNPLSAIKAAIEVIGIIDKNFQKQDTLDQMLVSINRCLQLVKIFLGFTKASYQLGNSTVIASDRIPFRDCWDYAMQLMRTRLVSTNLRLNFQWNVKQQFVVGNSNILTMMIYWLLSQFVNSIERRLLVSQNFSHDQQFNIAEDELSISIVFDVPVKDIFLAMEQSLLIKHLLEIEGLSLNLNLDNEIFFSKIDV